MGVTRYMSFVWRVIILQPGARVQTAPALKRNQRDTQSRLERAPTDYSTVHVQLMSHQARHQRDQTGRSTRTRWETTSAGLRSVPHYETVPNTLSVGSFEL